MGATDPVFGNDGMLLGRPSDSLLPCTPVLGSGKSQGSSGWSFRFRELLVAFRMFHDDFHFLEQQRADQFAKCASHMGSGLGVGDYAGVLFVWDRIDLALLAWINGMVLQNESDSIELRE